MNTRIITVLLLTSAFITGCSMAHGDPNHPRKNPHPAQRYEVIATAKAPGPWDKVKGYISYEVVSPKCTPEDKFLGVHAMPTDVGLEIEMTRVGGYMEGLFLSGLSTGRGLLRIRGVPLGCNERGNWFRSARRNVWRG